MAKKNAEGKMPLSMIREYMKLKEVVLMMMMMTGDQTQPPTKKDLFLLSDCYWRSTDSLS